MEIEKAIFPLSRYWYSGGFRFYYAYGNTPAQDFLQNCTGEKKPAILVLGCGDIRSCFYSFWKNFDVNGCRFDGVQFVMNDNSAAVLARNVLFLYLCLQMPEGDRDIRKWLSCVWAIWYCHELYPEHKKVLNNALHVLCKYSDAWSSGNNPLYPLVQFSTRSTLKEVKAMWKMWLDCSINDESVREMHSSRQKELGVRGWLINSEAHACGFVEGSTEIPCEENYDTKRFNAQKSEVLAYLKSGSVYAENVLGLKLPSSETFVNLTFYEKEDGQYNLHYRSLPFSCFYQTVEFSNRQVQSLKNASLFQLLVKNKHFISSPFLSNSVQQFSLWLLSSNRVLSSGKYETKISFTFDCSHALSFCYELENNKKVYPLHKFDLVSSSNLIDHLGPPNLVLSVVPLLKEKGILITTTLYKDAFSTIEQYLSSSFGFDCKLFPVILGIRCINHEGGGYASPVTIRPCPLTTKGANFVYRENFLIWEQVEPTAIPLVFSSGQQLNTAIIDALLNSVQVSVYPLLKTPKMSQMMNNLCVETAVKVLQVFMSNTCADFGPQFWKPLSDSLQKSIQPYLCSMQTQLFLHGIHMHLAVTEENCLICLQVPASTHIGLFSTKLFLQENYTTPKFIAIVHKQEVDDTEYLCDVARSNGDVHIFDCVSPSSGSDNVLQLYFYAPLRLMKAEYKVTVASVYMTDTRNISCNIMSQPTKLLGDLSISFSSFKFFQPLKLRVLGIELGSFGSITSHKSDGDVSDIEIDLSEMAMSASISNKLLPKRLSSSQVELSYGKCACLLKCIYPISYDDIKIKVRKSDKKMFIRCLRAFQQFQEEKTLFIISPDKELSLLPFALSEHALSSLSLQQFTKREHDIIKLYHPDISHMPPFLRAKRSLLHFFQTNLSYHFVLPGDIVHGLVLINNRFYDYETKTPVIDLAFCFLERSLRELVEHHWMNISPTPVCKVEVDYEQYEVIKDIFYYFAHRTNGTCNTVTDVSCPLNLLSKEKIEQYFTRAVISLLLCDPDYYFQTVEGIPQEVPVESLDSTKCDSCGEFFKTTQFCSICKKVKYCTKKCQRKHWKIHKVNCKRPEAIIKSNDAVFRPFPLSRYFYGGDFRFYYAYGNTPAEDFLQNCIDAKEPTILSLGCGDIRSYFYTLWKNCDYTILSGLKGYTLS